MEKCNEQNSCCLCVAGHMFTGACFGFIAALMSSKQLSQTYQFCLLISKISQVWSSRFNHETSCVATKVLIVLQSFVFIFI